jgi:hypothetical protein
MIQRPLRFAIERPVDFRFTDVRGGPRLQGRTVNISSTGVLMRTDQRIGVGRKLELIIRMARLTPDGPEVDLRLLGMAVRSGDGWVAVQARKHQILKRSVESAPTSSRDISSESGSSSGTRRNPGA